jgi:hypothetical protein
VRRLAEVEAPPAGVLLATYKAAEERLGAIPGVDVVHFGALRGLDRYRGHDTIVVAGREQPPPAEVEGLARSLFGDDEEPLVPHGGYTTATRGYRLRDGTRRGVEVAVHPDPRCQAILEQVRERETEQAVDRLRLVHREPAGPGDRAVNGRSTSPSTGWRVAGGGAGPAGGRRPPTSTACLPLAPAWLASGFPDLWETRRPPPKREVERAGYGPNP